jgi:hypothetical protein
MRKQLDTLPGIGPDSRIGMGHVELEPSVIVADPLPGEIGESTGTLRPIAQAPIVAEPPLCTAFPRRAVALVVLLALVVATVMLYLPRSGRLKLAIVDADGNLVLDARVLLDGKRVCPSQPCRADAVAPGSHHIRVSAPGFDDVERELTVARGTDTSLDLVLARTPPPSRVNKESAARLAEISRQDPGLPEPAAVKASSPTTVRANSIPVSSVLIDGRPVGETPASVPVSPGRHTVVFIHPTLGRRSVVVEALAARSSVASVRFSTRARERRAARPASPRQK